MQQKEVNTSVVSLESQIRHLREMLKYAKQYQKNKIYDDHYKSSKDPDRYFRKYESQIILFAGAEHILQENGIDLKYQNTGLLVDLLHPPFASGTGEPLWISSSTAFKFLPIASMTLTVTPLPACL